MNRYERQVERLLQAYPTGWRDERGEEMRDTIMELAVDDRERVSPRLAFDLLIGGWTERARRHVESVGPIAAGWRVAAGTAVVVQLVVAVIWLRDWAMTGTPAVIPHMIDTGLPAITYGLALVGFVVGAAAWLMGLRRLTQIVAGTAITAWLLTFVVFHAMKSPMWMDWQEVIIWTYLAAIATAGMFQPSPVHRRLTATVAVVAVLISQTLTTGVTPMDSSGGSIVIFERGFLIGLLDHGPNTLHTALNTGWALLAIAGLALVRIDPRPAVAACWTFPFLALSYAYWGGAFTLTGAVVAGLAALMMAMLTTRGANQPHSHDLST